MNSALSIIKDLLLKKMDPEEAHQSINKWIKLQSDKREIAKAFSALRLSRCLGSIANNTNKDTWYDAAGHLRQIILMYRERLQVHDDYIQYFAEVKEEFAFTIDFANEINCSLSLPRWLNHAKHIESVFDLELRRFTNRRIGDGLLYQATGYPEYASKEQKAIVKASLTMQEGQTLLACLPTGGGKSLIAQLPAFFETKGGQISGGVASAGTTIVIVPTVALAIDQNRSARQYFKSTRSEEYQPQAYYGGMDKENKKVIYDGVKKGTIPLVYTSPEAILNGPLYDIILTAAKENKINRLVIDEAHIVVDWGSAFRTDFQLLSVFRKKLLEASKGKLKTILLSATLTDPAVSTLCKLFSEDDNLIVIRSDALRFEPVFFLDQPKGKIEREERILQLLPMLPRPIILYVSSRESAIEWERSIRELGFSSVSSFTGDTDSDERERILKLWNDNDLDVMVATSAFGMGVDKSDIRTVIHCCIPESINRFYQEVGRGGRDGFASISLLSVIKEDELESVQMNNSAVLTVDSIIERWEKIRRSAKEFTGDSFWVDLNTRPHHLRNQETGNKNVRWNETTILFLYRHGFLDIVDIRKREEDEGRQLLVKMIQIETLSDRDTLSEILAPIRKLERDRFSYEFSKVKMMIEEALHECFCISFQETYPNVSDTCGGCPSCHANQVPPYRSATITEIETLCPSKQFVVGDQLKQYLGSYQDVLIYINNIITNDLLINIIKTMTEARIQTVIIPNLEDITREQFIKDMPVETSLSYSLLEIDEIEKDSDMYMLSGPIAIIYPELKAFGDWLYDWAKNYQSESLNNRIIHLAPKDYVIESERKQLQELIDGSLYNIEHLLTKVEEDEDWL